MIDSENKTLQTLHLYGNEISDVGAASLGNALAYVSTLFVCSNYLMQHLRLYFLVNFIIVVDGKVPLRRPDVDDQGKDGDEEVDT